jgi:hypothetical protein
VPSRVERRPPTEAGTQTGDWALLEQLDLSSAVKLVRLHPPGEIASERLIIDWDRLEELLNEVTPGPRAAAVPIRISRGLTSVIDWSRARPHDPDLAARWDRVVGGSEAPA